MKIVKLLSICLLVNLSSTILFAQKTKIVVGVAYKQMATSGCSVFNEAKGYEYIVSTNPNEKLSDLRNQIKNKLIEKFGVKSSNVMIHSKENTTNFQILSYNKKMEAHPCTKKSFAVGFGNSAVEASANANKEADLYCRKCSRTVEISY